MSKIQGAIMVSSLFQIVIGFTGLVGFLLRFIGPLTIAPTITLVGVALFKVAAGNAGTVEPRFTDTAAEEVSFEWSHNSIRSTVSKIKTSTYCSNEEGFFLFNGQTVLQDFDHRLKSYYYYMPS